MARREFAALPVAPRETGTVVVKTTGGALADVSLTEGGAAISGSTLTVAADGVIPGFWGPPDGTSTLVVTMHSHGLDWHSTVLASDSVSRAESTGVTIGMATVGDGGSVSVAFSSPWGIDGDGNPYYDEAGAAPGEDAILTVDATTGNFALAKPDGVVIP